MSTAPGPALTTSPSGARAAGYTAEETAATEADALALAANEVRVHEATVTGAPTVDIRF